MPECLIVGLDDKLEANVSTKIYPNPASDIVLLEIEGLRTKADVIVIDLASKVIRNYNIDKGENKLEIDVKNFAKGVYNVLVQNKEINISKKLVLE